jgi:hypothetical protein
MHIMMVYDGTRRPASHVSPPTLMRLAEHPGLLTAESCRYIGYSPILNL